MGTAFRAVSDTEMMEGRIITASTKMAASRLSPAGILKNSRMAGSSTIIPTRPYTTEGIPASRSTAGTDHRRHLGRRYLSQKDCGKKSDWHADDNGAGGAVDGSEDKGQDAVGGSVLLVESQRVPNKKSMRPTSLMAGRPEIIR